MLQLRGPKPSPRRDAVRAWALLAVTNYTKVDPETIPGRPRTLYYWSILGEALLTDMSYFLLLHLSMWGLASVCLAARAGKFAHGRFYDLTRTGWFCNSTGYLKAVWLETFRPVFLGFPAESDPRDPPRSPGPGPHINSHEKSAPQTNSKAVSRHPKNPARLHQAPSHFI